LGNLFALMFESRLLTLAGARWQRPHRSKLLIDRRFEFVVEIFEAVRFDVRERFLWRAVKNQLAAHQDDDLVEQLDVLHRVRREDDSATALRDLAKELHDLFFRRRI